MVQGLRCSVLHVPNDDIHTIPFFLKAGASVRCGISVSVVWGWQLGVVCDARRTEQRCVWSSQDEWNQSVSLKFFFHLAEVYMKLGAAQLSLPFVFRHMIWVHYCLSKGHQRHPLTKPHDPCPLKGGMWPTRIGNFRVLTSEGDFAVDQFNSLVVDVPWVTAEWLEE